MATDAPATSPGRDVLAIAIAVIDAASWALSSAILALVVAYQLSDDDVRRALTERVVWVFAGLLALGFLEGVRQCCEIARKLDSEEP